MDVENGDGNHGNPVKRDHIFGGIWAKIASIKLAGRNLKSMASGDAISEESAEISKQTLEFIVDKNPYEQQKQPLVEKERRKTEKVKKAAKPPRPPNGPTLNAADMRLIKEITNIAMKKRERVERIKALKKIQASRSQSPPSSQSLCGSTFVATIITILFALVLIFQGFGTSTYAISDSSDMMGAPLPSLETEGPVPVQFYKTVMSNNGAAPTLSPPK